MINKLIFPIFVAISPILSAVAAALGSLAVWNYKFSKEFKTRKTAEFLEKQLSEFYGPVLMNIKQVRSLTQLRYQEFSLFETYAHPKSVDDSQKHQELIQKHNKEISETIIPLWERILELFETKSHLGEHGIVEHYEEFLNLNTLFYVNE